MTYVMVKIDKPLLKKSNAYCRGVTKREAKNFYYGLKLLPEPKRSAMYALYAYMRLTDDMADAENGRSLAQRLRDLDAWQRQTHEAIACRNGVERHHMVWPAFVDLVHRYAISPQLLDDMVAGQRQDLEKTAIYTFEDLRQYCYRVASVVGLASIRVFGYTGGSSTDDLAVDRGIAFQLTNILRDLREDAAKGRCYIPQDEQQKFGMTIKEFAAGTDEQNFKWLMQYQIERAEKFYESSAGLEDEIEEKSRPTLRAMTGIYRGLLEKMKADPARVLRGRVSLPLWKKLAIGWGAMRGKG